MKWVRLNANLSSNQLVYVNLDLVGEIRQRAGYTVLFFSGDRENEQLYAEVQETPLEIFDMINPKDCCF